MTVNEYELNKIEAYIYIRSGMSNFFTMTLIGMGENGPHAQILGALFLP